MIFAFSSAVMCKFGWLYFLPVWGPDVVAKELVGGSTNY